VRISLLLALFMGASTEELDLFNSDGRVGVRFGLNIGFGF
jgi:hypothetical protein